MLLTDDQLRALPELASEIVLHDRLTSLQLKAKVVDLDEYVRRRHRRRELSVAAAWCFRARSNDGARS